MKKNNKTGSDRTARIVRLIIAACLAVFLWMYINGNDINMITQEINNIPVTLINTEKLSSKGLVLTEQKNYFVNIRVRGSERNVNTLDASQITATVDLAGVKGPGTFTADVVIQGLPNSVILQETQPSELNIKIDSIRHKAHSVTINTSGKPGNNLSVVSATTTDQVRVEGPSDSVNKIKACVATANVQDMTDDTDVYIPVKAVDKKGNVLSDVECKPSMIKASVKIGTTKRVKIKAPKTTGSVADGYKVAKITVSPKTVLLGGKASDLDSINAVRPSTVDLSGLKISTTVQKKLNLPSNVTNMDGSSNVTVTIKVEALTSKQLMIDDIEQRNVPDDLTVTKMENASVTVKIEGTSSELSTLDSKDLSAWIDFSDAAEGTGSYDIQVTTDKGTIKSVSPSSTSATLKSKN
ncbi:YbbR-like domain-containing protein [uncultured Pseudoramibacter sp.]|uniref:CdaR family protein n=1 Tax=uncultured Pseudoramibacter sp. TaxID=1623493 RepID=UPI0025D300C3|nr:CdaR family protein [uncultured Pseudoramibacter sp.]